MAELTYIPGKDAALEETIARAEAALLAAGIETEVVSWLNPVPDCWSVHLRAKDYPLLYTNGKGCSKPACYASALGEFLERLSSNFFFTDFYLEDIKKCSAFAFYPDEAWWQCGDDFSATSNIDS